MMGDFFNRYLNDQCKDADFEAAIDLLLSPAKRDLLNNRMKAHWDRIPQFYGYTSRDPLSD